jgi:hypothetical protein
MDRMVEGMNEIFWNCSKNKKDIENENKKERFSNALNPHLDDRSVSSEKF